MEDVNTPMDAAPVAAEVAEPTGTEPQGSEPTPEAAPTQPTQAQPERTVPYSAMREERMRRQELQRKLAEYEAQMNTMPQGEGDLSAEQIMAHPMFQQMMIEKAERDLKDYARELLDQHPSIPDGVRKAILRNPRGFVQVTTTDVENAKLDIQEYIEGMEDGTITPPVGKGFPVAPTNPSATQTAVRPAEIAKILAKGVDEMTDEDMKIVDEYKRSQPKR